MSDESRVKLSFQATYDAATGWGLARGTFASVASATSTVEARGPFTMVIHLEDLASAAGEARGFIQATTFTNGQPDGGDLFGNFGTDISFSGGTGTGGFGFAGPSPQDFAVTTNGESCDAGTPSIKRAEDLQWKVRATTAKEATCPGEGGDYTTLVGSMNVKTFGGIATDKVIMTYNVTYQRSADPGFGRLGFGNGNSR